MWGYYFGFSSGSLTKFPHLEGWCETQGELALGLHDGGETDAVAVEAGRFDVPADFGVRAFRGRDS
jgi:hypothetical protein